MTEFRALLLYSYKGLVTHSLGNGKYITGLGEEKRFSFFFYDMGVVSLTKPNTHLMKAGAIDFYGGI